MVSFTTRWLSTLGIGTLCFGILLFVIRVPVRTIAVFFAIGIPLIILWLYVDERSKYEQKRKNKKANAVKGEEQQEGCKCPICKHEQAQVCVENKCACCLMRKGDDIIGHSINPLQ
jgi:hypothetical protein